MPNPFAPERRPLDADVHDEDDVRRWLALRLTEEVATRREPIPAIHLLCDGYEEVLEWTQVHEADPGADLAATWHALAARTDVEHRILVLRLEHPDGTTEASAYEETWEDGRFAGWWWGRRAYVVENGIGRLVGAGWQAFVGDATSPRPPPFEALLTPAADARAAVLLPARPAEPDILMSTGEVPEGARLPENAMGVTELAAIEVAASLEREGMKSVMVFLVRGRTWEKWQLGSPLPTSGDDMVRWICGRLGAPDLVATAEGVVAEVDGAPARVVRIVGEMAGHRAERLLLMDPKPGKPEDVVPNGRWMARELGPVPEGEGWIGVAPMLSGDIALVAMPDDST